MAEYILGNPLRKLARERRVLQRLLWRLDYGFVWLLVKLFTLVPLDTASRLGERVGAFVGPRLKRKTEIYRENLAIAFPELGRAELDALVHEAWGRAGRVLAELPRLESILSDPDRLEIEVRGSEGIAGRPQNPAVFVSAHQSNWEMACLSLAALGIANTSVYAAPTNPLLDRMLHRSREPLNSELVPRDNSARPLLKALRKGRSAGLIVDRRVDEGECIRFFGQPKPSSVMPAWLALKTGAPLIPIQVQRLQDARFRVIYHPPLTPVDAAAPEDEQARDLTQQLHRQFEAWIRQEPRDWFCTKRLWAKGTQPQDTPVETTANVETHAA